MDERDLQRMAHIQTHCRDILYCAMLCGENFDGFSADLSVLERVRVALYHIGELAETFDSPTVPKYWKTVCTWSSLRSQDVQTINARTMWKWIKNEILWLLTFCDEVIQ